LSVWINRIRKYSFKYETEKKMKHVTPMTMALVAFALITTSATSSFAGRGEQKYRGCSQTCGNMNTGVARQACESGCSNAWGRSAWKANEMCSNYTWSRYQLNHLSRGNLIQACKNGVDIYQNQ
jgi:hypothetical protein